MEESSMTFLSEPQEILLRCQKWFEIVFVSCKTSFFIILFLECKNIILIHKAKFFVWPGEYGLQTM